MITLKGFDDDMALLVEGPDIATLAKLGQTAITFYIW